jgi:hypothetical protein
VREVLEDLLRSELGEGYGVQQLRRFERLLQRVICR